MIRPAPLNTCPPAPYTAPLGDTQANYSAIPPGDYASSSGEHRQQLSTPPAPHEPPVHSDSSWSFSADRAGMTQFCPPGECVSLSGIVSNSSTTRILAGFSNSYLPSSFATQSQNSRSEVWIDNSGASGHMTNGAFKMYCVRTLPDQREVTTSDGAGMRVECIGNIDVVFHGRSDEPIRLCDVSYVPDLRFDIFYFIRHIRLILLLYIPPFPRLPTKAMIGYVGAAWGGPFWRV